MHYSLVTAWMELQPCVNLKDLLIHNDDSPSICNQSFHLPPRIESIFSRGSVGRHCGQESVHDRPCSLRSSSPFGCLNLPSKSKWAFHSNGRGQALVPTKSVHSTETPFSARPLFNSVALPYYLNS